MTDSDYETPDDALADAVRVLGGRKKVGCLLKPEKAPEAAATWMSNCLDPERREHLTLEQILLILRRAAEVGHHATMSYIAANCGYVRPEPVVSMCNVTEFRRPARTEAT